MTTPASEPQTSVPTDIVARADKSWTSYRARRFAMVFMLLAYGAWSLYDGFINYPRENAEAAARGLSIQPHPGLDIPFNRAIGIILPPLALALFVWTLRASRGEVRLTTTGIIHAPGHPPVPLSAITEVYRDDWDRKGIASFDYELPDGKTGCIVLDDFVFEQDPIDAIYKIVDEKLPPAVEPPPGVVPEEQRPKALAPGQVSQRTKLIEKKKKKHRFR